MPRPIVTRSQVAQNLWKYVIGDNFAPEVIGPTDIVADPTAFILHIISDAESLGRALLEAMNDERVVLAFVLQPIDAGVGRVQTDVVAMFDGRAFNDFESVVAFYHRNSEAVLV